MATIDQDFHRDSLLDGGFSFRTALSLARASELAYEENVAALRATLSAWGLEPSLVFDQSDTEGFVAQDDQLLILAFRGTVSVADWLRNLKIARKEVPMGKVHGGFHGGLEAVWADQIEPVLRSVAGSGRKVWITGHSLGGALATLAGAWSHEWLDISGIYTFGQPLVGNREFARIFNRAFRDRFHRFVNHRDVVPKVPPAPLFAHVNQRVRFDEDGGIIEEVLGRGLEDEPEPEALSEDEFEQMQQLLDPQSAGERGLLPNLPFMSGIGDHNMAEGYLPKLRKNIDVEIT